MPTLSAKERRELPDRAFAYIDRERNRRLPINDEGHVRAALARFNQVQFEDDDARAEAFKRLLLAARKYGIVPIGFMTRQMRPGVGSSARAPKLPTGLVTLLFTDIEASTGLLEMLGDGYIDVLNDVRSLMRDAVGSAGGAEVDARADEFFAAFTRASDAVEAALAIQRDLLGRRWPGGIQVLVRAGIHSGKPKLTEGSYVGLPVHTANRVCSAAHGGQILISDLAREALDGAAPAGVSLRELGSFRLRGIARGHMLFQVEAPGLPVTFPPPREAGAVPATSAS
ncbi:MAG: adenylate/guanylate cyclase domain-containing protein [Actinomycetota bacterium]|nr:adenylate/guanylate cyclase domain-containing protein [Actinomycetota bacterium]